MAGQTQIGWWAKTIGFRPEPLTDTLRRLAKLNGVEWLPAYVELAEPVEVTSPADPTDDTVVLRKKLIANVLAALSASGEHALADRLYDAATIDSAPAGSHDDTEPVTVWPVSAPGDA